MVTKSARVCIVSGALISFSVPGSSLTTSGHPINAEVRRAEKLSRVPQKDRCPANSAAQKFTTSLHVAGGENAKCFVQEDQEPQLTSRTPSQVSQLSDIQLGERLTGMSSQRRKTLPSSRRRHLGSFAMTAYTQYHSPPKRTALGTMPAAGRTVAVDPRVIPLGTKLHIEGVGIRVAEDTGRKIKGKKLDLFLSSMGACTRFGIRSRQVYILD